MKLSEICIKRPVLAWVLTIVLCLVGIITGYRLSIEQYPKAATESPFISIETQYEGAGAEVMEKSITSVIEESLAGLEGVVSMVSNSSLGDSKIQIEFTPKTNLDEASNNIRDRISRSRSKLPRDGLMTEPSLTKAKSDDSPVMVIALTSKKMSLGDLNDLAKRDLDKEFEALSGVSRVEVIGAGDYKMLLYLDPTLMTAHNITIPEVLNAVRRQNVERPAGTLGSAEREYQVTVLANLEKPEEFEDLIITSKNGRAMKFKDIGRAELSTEDKKTSTRFNGERVVALQVYKQSGANPLDVAKEVVKKMESVKKLIPKDVKMSIAVDYTKYIERSIKLVYRTIFEATLLVILVVFLFLRSARASLIPSITIPVSLLGALFLMWLFGFTINVFTLMALVLAIGLVVDDAIVVLENVYRYLEKGDNAMTAAFKGIKEISFAVIAMTITLGAVYAPIALAEGRIGKLLTEFSITLAGAVFISGFVALTLSPMMCSRLLKAHKSTEESKNNLWNRFKNLFRTDKLLDFLEEKYGSFLNIILTKHRLLVFGCAFGFSGIGSIVFLMLPNEMIPREDKGQISIDGRAPHTATREFTERYVMGIDEILKSIPEVESRYVSITNPTYRVGVQLKVDRKRSTQDVVDQLKREFDKVDEREIKIMAEMIDNLKKDEQDDTKYSIAKFEDRLKKDVGLDDDYKNKVISLTMENFKQKFNKKGNEKYSTKEIIKRIQKNLEAEKRKKTLGVEVTQVTAGKDDLGASQVYFAIKTHKGHKELRDVSNVMMQELYRTQIISGIHYGDISDMQDYVVRILRDKAGELNVDSSSIAETIETLIRGQNVQKFKKEDGRLHDVHLEIDPKIGKASPDDIASLYIKSELRPRDREEAFLIPLSEIIDIYARSIPRTVLKYDRMRALTITASLKSGVGLGEAVKKIGKVFKDDLPKDMRFDFVGETKKYIEEQSTMILVFMLALCFIYCVMAAQFESWRDPFVIMLSVPLSLSGAVITLGFLPSGSINLFSNIGFVTLIGLIAKHGILIVDFSNSLREKQGMNILQSVIQASKARLRPILMTTFAMVLGSVPLAMASGEGSEKLQQIGWTIVGGMSIGTLFTLFAVPAFYTIITAKKRKFAETWKLVP